MNREETVLQKFGRNFSKDNILFRDGDLSKEMYVIQSGKVKIKKKIGDTEKTLALLGPGEFFGEMATLLDKPRSATAEVIEDSLLVVIAPQTFEIMISTDAAIAVKIIKRLAGRLLEANETIENLMLKDDLSRIIHILTQMAETGGTKGGEDVVINISPQELAQEASIEVSVANDLLKRLCGINLIEVEGKTIRVKSIYKLRFFDLLAIKKESGQI